MAKRVNTDDDIHNYHEQFDTLEDGMIKSCRILRTKTNNIIVSLEKQIILLQSTIREKDTKINQLEVDNSILNNKLNSSRTKSSTNAEKWDDSVNRNRGPSSGSAP